MMELHTRVSLLRNIVGAVGVVARDAREVVEGDLKKKVTCGSGCSNCCYPKILTDSAEGIGMSLSLRSVGRWNPEMRAKLVSTDAEMTKHTHRAWAERRLPCPLLDEKAPGRGVCTVYPARPLGCSMTFSIGGDPKLCAEVGYVDGGQIQAFYRGHSMVAYMHTKQALQSALGDAFVFTTLPGAVLMGEAIVEGKVLPELHHVTYEDGAHGVQEVFDAVAVVR